MVRIKFSLLVGLALAFALTLACGSQSAVQTDTETAVSTPPSQLDYPDSWPDEFVRQVHEEFDGAYEGIDFNDFWYRYAAQPDGTCEYVFEKVPTTPDECTLEQFRSEYYRLINAYKYIAFLPEPVGAQSWSAGSVVQHTFLPNASGEPALDEDDYRVVISLTSDDRRPEESLLDAFLSGGIDIPEYSSQHTAESFIPWDNIIWAADGWYFRLLDHHYKLGSESPLCDVLARESREPIENFCSS